MSGVASMKRHTYAPTPEQWMLIKKAGLDPSEWSVRYENDKWLALADRDRERRRTARIDLDTMELKMP